MKKEPLTDKDSMPFGPYNVKNKHPMNKQRPVVIIADKRDPKLQLMIDSLCLNISHRFVLHLSKTTFFKTAGFCSRINRMSKQYPPKLIIAYGTTLNITEIELIYTEN